MTDDRPHSEPVPPDAVVSLISTALRARQRGDTEGARTLLRALAARQPGNAQVWLALATVAETREEQFRALERAVAIMPENVLAQRGLERMRAAGSKRAVLAAAVPPAQAVAPASVVTAPASLAAEQPVARRPTRWLLVAALALALVVLSLAVLLGRRGAGQAQAPTPALQGIGVRPAATAAPAGPAGDGATSTAGAGNIFAPIITSPNTPTPSLPAPTAAPTAVPTPVPPAQPGEVFSAGGWNISLLRPQDALALDGAIGSLQPRGRFVLALLAVSNNGQAPARLPPDLVALSDASGNRYLPIPAASTAYLDAYGRGRGGDLSMEDAIPPGGNVSVPLIFDVPPGVGGLTIVVGDGPRGWPVGQ